MYALSRLVLVNRVQKALLRSKEGGCARTRESTEDTDKRREGATVKASKGSVGGAERKGDITESECSAVITRETLEFLHYLRKPNTCSDKR